MELSKGLAATVFLTGITIPFVHAEELDQVTPAALDVELTEQASEQRGTNKIPSIEAYEYYELGRKEMAERTVEAVRRAKRHFEHAIELDPEYAKAYVGIADALGLLTFLELKEPAESLDARQAAIDRALDIDPNLGEAYASLGLLRQHQGAIEEAEQDFLKSIELSPSYATAYKWYANLLSCQKDRKEDSLPLYRKAFELEPTSPIIQENLARTLMLTGRTDEAKKTALAALEQNPNSALLYGLMADILRWNDQRFGESLRWARAASRLDPLNPTRREMECELLVQLGMDDEAETCLHEWESGFPDLPEYASIAIRRDLYLMRGEPQEAVKYVEQLARPESAEGFQWLLGETYALNGQFAEARPIYEKLRPKLFAGQDAAIPEYNLGSAITVGQILYAAGDQGAANHLFDWALETISTMDRAFYGYIDANIYMTRGEKKAAADALRASYEAGMFGYWWYLKAPVYGVMRDEPEWNDAVGQVLAEIKRQREHYQQTKDDPLM